MLKAEGSFILPDNVPANEFLNLENDKISTSRNWAVWLHEYLVDFKGKQDVLRYVLCANAPETKDNDFTWKDFQDRNNNELVAILGNFVNRALVLTHKYFDGSVPEKNELTDFDVSILNEIKESKENLEDNLEHFKFREALKDAMNMARAGNKYLADTEPWKLIKTDKERVKTILNLSLQITANLAIVMEPFMPFTAEKLSQFINGDKPGWNLAGTDDILKPGHKISKPGLLFEKVEDEAVDYQRSKLGGDSGEKALKVTPEKEEISFDDFTKMDIRVGTIKSAEKVPKTKKLLKFSIDTQIDTRTVVSGIAEFYKPEDIIGLQVCVLVNLQPRKIRGIESKGMILMAEDSEGNLQFVKPDSNIENGAVIR